MTLAEKVLWQALRKLPANVRRQAPIGRYFADFCCHGPKVVVEVDGPFHDLDHDAKRDPWLANAGFRVLRFTNSQIAGADPLILSRILAAAGHVGPIGEV